MENFIGLKDKEMQKYERKVRKHGRGVPERAP